MGNTPPERLRERIAADEILVLPGAYDALSARLAERTGFDAAFTSGFSIAATMLGLPDMGMLTMAENVERAEDHRSVVRCEYYQGLDQGLLPEKTVYFGTMLRTDRYKLVRYHGHDTGELFDLKTDPHEFENLWKDPDYRDVWGDLLTRSFDELACAVERGPEQIGRY